MEALLQQERPLNGPAYFIVIAAATILYYTNAYVTESTQVSQNPRTIWYDRNRVLVRGSQLGLLLAMAVCSFFLLKDHVGEVLHASWVDWLLVLVFPVGGVLYYGLSTRLGSYNLRRIGWLKPFVIGFIWAGLATIYPVLFQDVLAGRSYDFTLIGAFLFIKNFMFVSVLCIMFDIKDYAMDFNAQLKTFVVKVGLRRTIFQIIIPLCIAGLACFLIYGVDRGFTLSRLVFNIIPFLLLLRVAYALHNRQSVFYYLIIIDGLMLVKAICGSLGMVHF